MPGLRDQGSAIGSNWAFAFHNDMHSPATGIGLSWEYQHAELSCVEQTTFEEEPLPYVSHRRRKQSRPPTQQQLPVALKSRGRDFGPQFTKQLLLNGRSADLDSCDGSSSEGDDLAAMVDDFIENDSGNLIDHNISDRGSPSTKLSENLQALTAAAHGSLERELLTDVKMLVLTIQEDTDLICDSQGNECKGGCTKRFVVKHLKASGYNAAVCKSRWQSTSSVPGGEYEYIDVMCGKEESGDESMERCIVDIDFQAQFEIARPTQQYEAALKALPMVFVGTSSKLKQVLEIMSDAAKDSLKQNAMHLPPWRTLYYMSAKWFSNFEGKSNNLLMSSVKGTCSSHWKDNRFEAFSDAKLCVEQLRRIKVSLLAEMKGSALSNLPRGRRTTANLMLQRRIL